MRYDTINIKNIFFTSGANKRRLQFAAEINAHTFKNIMTYDKDVPLHCAIRLKELTGLSLDDFYLRKLSAEEVADIADEIRRIYSKRLKIKSNKP